jgi:hypothetical protein
MLGIKGANSNNNPYTKPLSSPREPGSSHVNNHFGGSSSPNEGDPFNSNFGFGSPPPQNHGGPSSPSSFPSSTPYSSGVKGNSFSRPQMQNSFGNRRPVRQQPAGKKKAKESFIFVGRIDILNILIKGTDQASLGADLCLLPLEAVVVEDQVVTLDLGKITNPDPKGPLHT